MILNFLMDNFPVFRMAPEDGTSLACVNHKSMSSGNFQCKTWDDSGEFGQFGGIMEENWKWFLEGARILCCELHKVSFLVMLAKGWYAVSLLFSLILLLSVGKTSLKKKHLYNKRSRISACLDFLFLLVVLVLILMYSFVLNCSTSTTILKGFSNITIQPTSKFISGGDGYSVCFLPYSIWDF